MVWIGFDWNWNGGDWVCGLELWLRLDFEERISYTRKCMGSGKLWVKGFLGYGNDN